MIYFSATAMWDNQKESFVQQTTHLVVCMVICTLQTGLLSRFANGSKLGLRG